MKDRVSATPGRMLITPENGQPAFYATVELADNPSVEGTPLNKANLLTDATAALFGLGSDAVPDEVLGIMGEQSIRVKTLNKQTFSNADGSSTKTVVIPLTELPGNKRHFVNVTYSDDFSGTANFCRISMNNVDNGQPFSQGNRTILSLVSGDITTNQYASGKYLEGEVFLPILKTLREDLSPPRRYYATNWVNEGELMFLYGYSQTQGKNPVLLIEIEQEIQSGTVTVNLLEEQ